MQKETVFAFHFILSNTVVSTWTRGDSGGCLVAAEQKWNLCRLWTECWEKLEGIWRKCIHNLCWGAGEDFLKLCQRHGNELGILVQKKEALSTIQQHHSKHTHTFHPNLCWNHRHSFVLGHTSNLESSAFTTMEKVGEKLFGSFVQFTLDLEECCRWRKSLYQFLFLIFISNFRPKLFSRVSTRNSGI